MFFYCLSIRHKFTFYLSKIRHYLHPHYYILIKGEIMTVYADILIGVNIIINFLLLMLTGKICKTGYKTIRVIAAAFLGGLFSLYIFLPQSHIAIELAIKSSICLLITFVGFGFCGIKHFIKTTFCFLCCNMLFGGIVLAVWGVFKPNGIIVNNGMVYFDVSPILLISTTIISYFAITLISRFTKNNGNKINLFNIKIFYKENSVDALCLMDTGNSLTDNLSDRPVILINQALAFRLLEQELTLNTVPKNDLRGFRVIPYHSVGSEGLLPAFKADYIILNNKKIYSCIIAVTTTDFKDYDGLIGESLLENN